MIAIVRSLTALAALLCLLVASGCSEGSLDVEHPAEAAAVSRQNAAKRRLAHRQAMPAVRRLRRSVLTTAASAEGCGADLRRPAPTIDGVRAVACGDLGRDWPLRVDYGFVRCEPKGRYQQRGVVFTAPDGKDYAASVGARMDGYPRIGPVFVRGAGGRYRSRLTAIGLGLCD